jgi:hypothetical protein
VEGGWAKLRKCVITGFANGVDLKSWEDLGQESAACDESRNHLQFPEPLRRFLHCLEFGIRRLLLIEQTWHDALIIDSRF